MTVCVYGLWHLGAVTSAGLASLGHHVIGLDEDAAVIERLQLGTPPVWEPQLEDLIKSGLASGQLQYSSQPASALGQAGVLWVTFDTPVDENDCADVDWVISRIRAVLPLLPPDASVVISSQLPVGSVRRLERFAAAELNRGDLVFACSPENLRLGKALDVFLQPDRIVVGVRPDLARQRLEPLFASISSRVEWMSVESAEMTKHAINSFLATSVTFANELASICELVGADAKQVERGLKTDVRIGPKAYLAPGGPFAGGTLARDISFLESIGATHQVQTPLLASVRPSNDQHKNWIRRRLQTLLPSLTGARIAIWGLTYKPGTDTLRRSLAVELVDWLIDQGALPQVFDPVVTNLPDRWEGRVLRHPSALAAASNASVLVVGTELPEFRSVASELNPVSYPDLVVIDANRFLHGSLRDSGLNYIAVGVPMPIDGI
jgi:UDPglucose 6-dehydrogenase